MTLLYPKTKMCVVTTLVASIFTCQRDESRPYTMIALLD